MEGVSALALVAALLKRLREKGILTDEDSQAVYRAAITVVAGTDVNDVLSLSKEEWINLLERMSAMADRPPEAL